MTGDTVHVAFEGSADAIVKAAARTRSSRSAAREDDLEDIFLGYSEEPKA